MELAQRGEGGFRVVPVESEAAAKLKDRYLDRVKPPKPKKKRTRGALSQWKHRMVRKATPTIERIQNYASETKANKFRVLAMVIAVMMVFAVLKSFCAFGVGYCSGYLSNKAVQRLREHVYEHLTGLDLQFFTSHSTGSLMAIPTQDVPAVSGAIGVLFSSVMKTPVTVGVLVGVMFTVSPSLTLFTFTVVPLMAALLFFVGKRVRKSSLSIQEARARLTALMQEAFSGIRVVKAYNMEDREVDKYTTESRGIFNMSMRVRAVEEIGGGTTEFLGILTVAVMILAGGYYTLATGELGGSDFVFFVGLLSQVFRPARNVSRTNTRIQRGLAGADRVFRALDTQCTVKDKPDAVKLQPLQHDITFENVSFTYDEKRGYVLEDINLTVKKGKVVAFVGETGAGKSTLINLLPRFYDPTVGSIKFDGLDIRDVTQRSLRRQIALITQDVILFDDTVANNIAYGCDETVTREQIEEAAKAANAHDFIMGKPKGYDTMIGSHGVRLSGGERQRLAIARAIIKNSPILILDEATSSLDSRTEALIQDALARLMKTRTVFVIAHRLSTIQHCDEIFVLEKGRFVESGTHEQLLRMDGRYARFYSIQFGSALNGDSTATELETLS
jgi:subfamily B ATP-binding cassette protein MsbA